MNLKMKKQLAARTLNVGMGRIIFARIDEIKEAITKQDIRELASSGAIAIKERKGRKRKEKRRTRARAGKIKKKIMNRKQRYAKLTRKLREYAKQLFLQKKISKEQYKKLRKEIKSRMFRSKSHLKESSLIKEKKMPKG